MAGGLRGTPLRPKRNVPRHFDPFLKPSGNGLRKVGFPVKHLGKSDFSRFAALGVFVFFSGSNFAKLNNS